MAMDVFFSCLIMAVFILLDVSDGALDVSKLIEFPYNCTFHIMFIQFLKNMIINLSLPLQIKLFQLLCLFS